MRNVIFDTSMLFGIVLPNKKITVKLMDKYGNSVTQNVKTVETDGEGKAILSLAETEKDFVGKYYSISVDNEIPIRLYVPIGDGDIKAEEWGNTLKSRKFESYVYRVDGNISIDEAFVNRVDTSFLGGFINEYDSGGKQAWLAYEDKKYNDENIAIVSEFDKLNELLGQKIYSK